MAGNYPFARPLVNSGRLSTPTPYRHSSLNTPDDADFAGNMYPGANCADAPVTVGGKDGWFLHRIGGAFTIVTFGPAAVKTLEWHRIAIPVLSIGQDIQDSKGRLAERYDARPGTTYLIRPDQHVAARWRGFDPARIRAALARACAMAH